MRKLVLAVFVLVCGLAGAHDELWTAVTGRVDGVSVVAVDMSPERIPWRGGDLRNGLRIRNDKGEMVPYLLREQRTCKLEKQLVWKALAIVSVAETNGTLKVVAQWPEEKDKAKAKLPATFARLRVHTPLADFEQVVEVFADGKRLGGGVLCDYGRYADFRRNEIALETGFCRRLEFSFSRPSSQRENEVFGRIVTTGTQKNGEVVTSIRRSVKERPFRINQIEVAWPVEVEVLRAVPPVECTVPAKITQEQGCTILDFSTDGFPLVGVALPVKSGMFSRQVRVYRRQERGWREFASGKVVMMDLPGRSERSLAVSFPREIDDAQLRLVVENGDSAPLDFDGERVLMRCRHYEVAFIAKPGERYEMGAVKADKPIKFDDAVVAYIDKARVPACWELGWNGPRKWSPDGAADPGIMRFLCEYGVTMASVVVFALLGLVCWKLMSHR